MLLFHRITTQLKSSFDLARLYEILMDSLISNLGAESGAIYLRRGLTGELRPEFMHGLFPPPKPLPEGARENRKGLRRMVREMPVPPGEGIVGKVAESGTPLYLYEAQAVRRHYTWRVPVVTVRTAVALPLRSPEGIYGVVQVVNRLDGDVFSEDDVRFMSLLVEQAGLAIYNARLHAERLQRQRSQEQIKIARNIQLSLLPKELPDIPQLAIGAEYDAAQEVGGDYYDIYRIDHDHLGLIVFDVAGKGVPGALLMAITATFLKMAAPRSRSPAWVLNEVNAALSAEMHRGLFVTAVYAVLQISTGELTVCSAGHPDAVVARAEDGRCENLNPRGAALGLLRPNRFRATLEQVSVVLHPGDTLLLYTDGVIEARNTAAEEFGADRLLEVVRAEAAGGPRRLAEEIHAAVLRFAGEEPQYDDTTVLALQRLPESAS
jgi:sigma-B regulation protein RsbU (phosphoserine phosphatase)